jgi:3-phenylpropionate/trans-cinnamate dioxygenase ferredoxin reductase component
MSGVLVVGAGLAGARTAETLRSEGYDGEVTLVGDEPVPPYERPALSKEFLAGTRDEASLLLRPASYWRDRDVRLVLGDGVVALDPVRRRARTRRGTEFRFEHAVLATGARPRRLPLERPLGVHELRTLRDAQRLREELLPGSRLLVIGGGFVGAEVASTAHGLGVEVTIVEAAEAPVARILGAEVGHLLAGRWRASGIDVHLQTGVAHLRADAGGRLSSVLLTNGDELRADAALVGIGVEPARELVPERPCVDVHLAGDVAGPGHWTAAALDGGRAARRILHLPQPAPQPPYVWSDQFGLRLQIVGTPSPDDTTELDGIDDGFTVRYVTPAGEVGAALFANRPAEAGRFRRELAERTLALAA